MIAISLETICIESQFLLRLLAGISWSEHDSVEVALSVLDNELGQTEDALAK